MKRQVIPPMSMLRTIYNTDIELRERACVVALEHGVANVEHFNQLMFMMNLLMVAGFKDSRRRHAYRYAEDKVKPVLTAIRNRQQETGELTASVSELQVLKELIDFNRKFWVTQPTSVYSQAVGEVKAFYRERGY